VSRARGETYSSPQRSHRRGTRTDERGWYDRRGSSSGIRVEIVQVDLQNLDGLLLSCKGNQEMFPMLDEMRVIDMTPAHQPGEAVEYKTIVTDRESERIAFFRIGIRDKDVASVAQPQAVQLGSRVGKICPHRLRPGSTLIGRKGAVEEFAPPVVAEESDE